MDRYWIYIEKQIQGPFEVQELLAVKGFCDTSQVCIVGEDTWEPARQFPAIRFQLAPTIMKIADASPAPPRPTLYQAPHATRVSNSGDYISPDFQFEILHQRPNMRLRRSKRHSSSVRTFRAVPLPQPSKPSASRGLTIFAVVISLTGGLWAYGIHPALPAPLLKWWQSYTPKISHTAPLPQRQRPPVAQPATRPHKIPTSVSKPAQAKTVVHKSYPKRQASAHTSHSKLKPPSRKPWFSLRDKPAHRHP